ncbi:flagellar basal body-associated FliL family protein [Limnohabitans radicicola]|uniref:Flagellar protein FliL n=1 Tax=Limnohabitans radicicola TaxID=2771427 RepID=A0A927FE42_9BURK|nr:flagellar basal body-associated FliL family protein [Limnohabitans radicicola]MBD8048917.1 flagellar basal body-associated FliL family protein [Limnohabitans radicicola]
MADEEIEVEEKKKSPLIKIIIFAVVGILVLAGTVVGTMFVTGFFDKKDSSAVEARLAELEAAASAAKAASEAIPQKVTKDSPELTRFENSYMDLEKPLVSNMMNSRKVMQVNVSIMTHYDERVFKNVKKHEVALRSVALDVMRQQTDAELNTPEFRKELANKIRDAMNKTLEKYEDFGGIEEIFFSSFVVQ